MYYLRTDSTADPEKCIVGRRTCDVKLTLLCTRLRNKNVCENSKSFELKIRAAPQEVNFHENRRLK